MYCVHHDFFCVQFDEEEILCVEHRTAQHAYIHTVCMVCVCGLKCGLFKCFGNDCPLNYSLSIKVVLNNGKIEGEGERIFFFSKTKLVHRYTTT